MLEFKLKEHFHRALLTEPEFHNYNGFKEIHAVLSKYDGHQFEDEYAFRIQVQKEINIALGDEFKLAKLSTCVHVEESNVFVKAKNAVGMFKLGKLVVVNTHYFSLL
jgi:hypothetical protein